jgi:hypothetical protein
MKFSREYEQQADILGSHIMANAGYDPRDMANMFRTIEKESGSGGPQWLSDHPNPGNRAEYITRKPSCCRAAAATRANSSGRRHTCAHCRARRRWKGALEETNADMSGGNIPGRRDRQHPAARLRTTAYPRNLFRVSAGELREIGSTNSVTFAPDGATGSMNGNSVFTHGVEIGMGRNESHDLQTATSELLDSLRQSNPRLSASRNYDRGSIGGRQGLHSTASNVSDITGGQEAIEVYTTLLPDGSLFYVLGVAPREDYNAYSGVFRNVVRSIQFTR